MTTAKESESSLSKMICLSAAGAGVAGIAVRIYGINRSLWQDEFGTLWAIEGSFSQLVERVNAFQGQSLSYYSPPMESTF
jgi:hypothetical protein